MFGLPPSPLSPPRLFSVACDSSGGAGAAVLPRDTWEKRALSYGDRVTLT